ncbi:MAG: hypothetical protein WB439_04880 [Acidobacteriaceae bacterium]
MGYYIRVLSKHAGDIPLDKLLEAARPAVLENPEEAGNPWQALLLKHPAGGPIAVIERNLVVDGELAADEVQEFIEEVADCKPTTAAKWLQDYLPGVKVIYAFQVLNGAYESGGWDALHSVYSTIWKSTGGILQADAEGFSNEDGLTVLWQFSEEASGPWNVAVLDSQGKWKGFSIDLEKREHREAFQQGCVPPGVATL